MNALGSLYIVATPIGNLGDFSLRAQQTLQNVDAIAAEDTRHSHHLLQHFQINTPMISLHAHNEQERSLYLLAQLKQGKNIALISDAGTPLISDPGYCLVSLLQKEGIKIVPIPGACALIAALSVSGLPSDRFIFEGFLPAKSSQRRRYLESLRQETRTLIFYEAPHRILGSLEDLVTTLGAERKAVLARELTKTFETLYHDSLGELLNYLQQNPQQQKGEFVVLLHGATPEAKAGTDAEALRVLDILLTELPTKQAAHLTAAITGARKNELYAIALDKKL